MRFRRSDCDIIQQLEDIVNKSSTANEAVRYPTWCWRDWKTFFCLHLLKQYPA
ncbi:hypothetical protein DPMN_017954 [Dreissena polymorpha]|uniref:Uncharacterized protein n=1 Tax=Dreissena polymorpha TaxID=45954 RepID=A0A9D4NII6_DREPO|nr:hypothetical protein DPMN_017954 [Dreissena polymorpha]